MASTYDNNLRLREMGTGCMNQVPGVFVLMKILELIGEALGYGTEQEVSGTTHTTTIADVCY